MRATHRSELDNLNSARILDLTQQDSRHELEVSAIHAESKQELRGLEITWQQRLRDSTEEATRRLEADWQRKEERWGETRRSLEDQVRSLQTEIRDQDIIARAKNKGDLQLQVSQPLHTRTYTFPTGRFYAIVVYSFSPRTRRSRKSRPRLIR